MASTIRDHLEKHGEAWISEVQKEKLKGWDKLYSPQPSSSSAEQKTFTLEGSMEQLTKWIVVDDQVTCPVLYCNLVLDEY
jgi:hypothetical protein